MLAGYTLINHASVHAASGYSSMPTHLSPKYPEDTGSGTPISSDIEYDQYISNGHNDSSNSGNHTPSFRFLVYAPASATSVNISIGPGATDNPTWCGYYNTIAAQRVSDDDPGGATSDSFGDMKDLFNTVTDNPTQYGDCQNVKKSNGDIDHFNITLKNDSDIFWPSQRFGPSFVVAAVYLRTDSTSGRFLSAEAHGANVRLSYAGVGNDLPDYSTGDGLSFSRTTSGFGETRAYFAPSCDYGTNKVTKVYYQDADSNTAANAGGTISYKVFEGNGTLAKDSSGNDVAGDVVDGNSSANDSPQSISFLATKGKKYHITFYNVLGRGNGYTSNTIKIWHPFDSAAYYRDCPPTPGGQTTKCNEVYVKDDDGYNPPGGTDEVHGTNTFVTIKDSVGWVFANNYTIGKGDDHTFKMGGPGQSTGKTLNIQITRKYITHHSDGSTTWTAYSSTDNTYTCYNATCNIESTSGDLGSNQTTDGGSFAVSGKLFNNNADPQGLDLPANIPYVGTPLSISVIVDGALAGSFPIGNPVAKGGWVPYNISINVGGGIAKHTVRLYPDYYGRFAMDGYCDTAVDTYKHFDLTPTAEAKFVNGGGQPANAESPTGVEYDTYVTNNNGFAVSCSGTSSRFYENPGSGGAQLTRASPQAFNNDCTSSPSKTDTWTGGTYTIPPAGLFGGDQYCTSITLPYTSGWRGPNSSADVLGSNGQQTITSNCPKVVNKPYFKVYGSGVCSEATLASWNHNTGTYPGSFGASAQIGALSVNSPIYGFATAQSAAGDTSKLSFANDTTSTDDYTPNIGGQFGGSSTCVTSIDAPQGATVATTKKALSSLLANNHLAAGEKTEIYSNEDVYVDEDVAYDGGGTWTDKTIPSFALRTKGNIYIAPNVTRLDGLYSSDKTIFTCGKPDYSAIAQNDLFNSCNNQLVVHGSFVAKKVNLMRTFGSLRDEKPTVTGATAGTPKTPTTFCFSEFLGDTTNTYNKCKPDRNYTCYPLSEPGNIWWGDNGICTSVGSSTKIVWSSGGKPVVPAGWKCNLWNGVDTTRSWWTDNYLCSNNTDLYFSPTNQLGSSCTHFYDSSDPITGGAAGGDWLCESLPISGGSPGSTTPHVASSCSKSLGAIAADPRTCAAEVFDFSPELYLSPPNTKKPSSGALHYDAITSLPPVL